MLKITQNSWAGGQLDKELAGRQDIDQYKIGASELRNFLPIRRGSIRKRPGTDFFADITDFIGTGAGRFRIVPFGYTASVGFVLVMAGGACRAYRSDGTWFSVSGDFPYSSDELDDICYVQCGDILYLAHQNHPPAQIEHDLDAQGQDTFLIRVSPVNLNIDPPTIKTGATSTYVERQYVEKAYRGGVKSEIYAATVVVEIDGEEYESRLGVSYSGGNADGETDPSDKSSNNRAHWAGTSYYAPFTESQVNNVTVEYVASEQAPVKSIRLFKDIGGLFGLIAQKRFDTAQTTGGTYKFQDNNIAPDTSIAPMDDKKVFDSPGDYPGCVALYQQRLVWAGTRNDPARVWMSAAGDFYENRPHETLQVNDPIDFILPITQFARINFIVELGKLLAFGESSELLIGSNSDNTGVAYNTIMATTQSHLGCKRRLPPIVVNNSLLFADRTGQSVRDYNYKIEDSLYGGSDISIFSSDIFGDKSIVDWTYQQHPNSTVWCVLSDGSLASLTYIKEQNFCAWATHTLGGGGFALGVAKTCAIFANDSDNPTTSEVILAVRRSGRILLEKMRPWPKASDTTDHFYCADCVRDGVGFPFTSVMTTMHPVLGDSIGNSQFDIKLGQHAHLRTLGAFGGSVRAVGVPPDQASQLESEPVEGETMTATEHDENVLLAGNNSRDARVTVTHEGTQPFHLILLELDYDVEEGGDGQ